MKRASIGRIVIYHTTETERAIMSTSPECNKQEHLPAVVVANWSSEGVENQTINVKVLLDGKGELWKTSIQMGEGEGQWSWPEINN